MLRKRTASFLSGVLVASSIPFVGVAAFAPPAHAAATCATEFGETRPVQDGASYVIASEENLNYLLQQFNSGGFDLRSASFVQSRDLDMNGCEVSRPMADSLSNAFQGAYNGAGFEIADLVIDASAGFSDFVGLFGYLGNGSSAGSISNLGFSGVVSNGSGESTGSQGTGGLVGYLYWGSVANSYTTGSVTGSSGVGGLVGYQNPASRSATISNSWSSANVSANATGEVRFGGLVGALIGGSISGSYATGAVGSSGVRPDFVGGLVGTAQQASQIQESFATGAVFGGDSVGGLIGSASGTSGNPTVEASYARGSVDGSGTAVGGLFGYCSRGTVLQSYVTGPVTGPTSGAAAGFVGAVIGNRANGNCAPNVPKTLWDADTAIATSNQGTSSSQGTPSANLTESDSTAMTNVDTYLDTSIVFTAWSIGSGWDSSGTKTWGICSAFNDGYPFLNALYSSDPCTGGGGGGSASGSGPPAEFEFTFWLPDGSECTSIGPVIVVDGTSYTLPGVDADCRTMPGALVGGWTIPVEPGFTGAGSSSLPFQPDHVVEVVSPQQFTVVPYEPVLVIELDANVDFVDTCVPTDVEHQSPDHMFRYKWVPRELISLARLPERASCEAPGYRLVGWNTEADGSGTTFELKGPIPEAWGTALPNSHHLFGMWERIA